MGKHNNRNNVYLITLLKTYKLICDPVSLVIVKI